MKFNWGLAGLRGSLSLENTNKQKIGTFNMVDVSNCKTFVYDSNGLKMGEINPEWSMEISIRPGDAVSCHVTGPDGTNFPFPISSMKIEFVELPYLEEIKKINKS